VRGYVARPARATVGTVKKNATAPAPAAASRTRRSRPGRDALLALLRTLEQHEPGSDEALEAARDGLVAGVRSHRFEVLQARVVATWAAQIATKVIRSLPDADHRRAEVLAEARLWVLEQLLAFRPAEDGGNVGAFLRSRQTWFRSQALRTINGHTVAHGRHAVLGTIGRVREEFTATERREPTGAELRARVEEILTAQTRDRLLETPAGQRLDETQLQAAVQRRLRKDGVLSALDRFDEVRVESLPPIPLLLLDAEEDTPGWGVPLPVVQAPDVGHRDEETSFESLLQVALGDHQWARTAFSQRAGDAPSGADGEGDARTLKQLATASGHSTTELKEVLAAARCRVLAPHAQWAHLGPDVDLAE